MKICYFWNFAFLDLGGKKSKKDLRSFFFFFFFKTNMDSKSTYKHNNKASKDNVIRIATNRCSLISDYSQKIPTNNPQMACQNKFIFLLETFQVSTLECGKIHFIFSKLEIRAKPYANDKTHILE